MIDLEQVAFDMDRGNYRADDANVLANEYENLGLEGCAFNLERIYTGCGTCEDMRALHNAIELEYDKRGSCLT